MYDFRMQLALLLNDVRGHVWSPRRLDSTLVRMRERLAEECYAIEKRELLILPLGVKSVALPTDHVQSLAFLRGTFSVSARFLDPLGALWWLVVDSTGIMRFTGTTPTGAQLLTATAISWLRMWSADSSVWYLSPSALGDSVVSSVQPSGGGQIAAFQLRDEFGIPWYLQVTNAGDLQSSRAGNASVIADDVEVEVMQRMEPEARQRADPRLAVGPPKYYAIEGKTLWVDPTPDATYQVEHLYYATDVSLMTSPWQSLSVLAAAASCEMGSHGVSVMYGRPRGAALQLGEMADLESKLLQELYASGPLDTQRDARGSITGVAR